ncbi:MAG TPA: hypothetical protein VKD08_08250 [Ignavibacteriaceae bacterium]|nr:hypothetical protein [Ignavibacteriaceae bacterium]
MSTLSQVIEILSKKGFKEDFGMTKDGFTARNSGEVLIPENIKIIKTYRFEGESNPDDMSILYAMETNSGVKGILVDAYGTYAGNEPEKLSEFLKKVKIRGKEN